MGVPFEDRAGSLNQLWHQDVTDVAGAAETDDWFGYALAAIPSIRHEVYLPLELRQ